MTQNTADRLYLLLVDRLRVIGGTRHAAEDIAAEINALTAERDAARRIERMAVDGRGRENVARITHEVWSMWMRELLKAVSLPEDVLRRLQTPYHNLPADDQASCLSTADDYIRAIGVPLVKIANDTRKERDEAQAEVERLRPAAEAWDAREKWLETSDVDHRLLAQAAAARARAAKESQP